MAEPMSSFMCRVERARGEDCSFPTVIKSYDPQDPSVVPEADAEVSELGCASTLNTLLCAPSSPKCLQKVPCALFWAFPKKPAPVLVAEQAEHFHGKGTWQGGPGGVVFQGSILDPF